MGRGARKGTREDLDASVRESRGLWAGRFGDVLKFEEGMGLKGKGHRMGGTGLVTF